jgi:hypothetical protein
MVADQVASSGSNILLMLLVLRASSRVEFGAFSLALIVHGIFLGCSRALFGEVMLLRLQRDVQDTKAERRAALGLVICFSTMAAITLAGIALMVPSPLDSFFATMAVAAPFVHVQDLQRYVAFGDAQARTAVFLDSGWLIVQLAVSAGIIITTNDPRHLVLGWVAGAAASGIGGLIGRRWLPSLRCIPSLVREEKHRSAVFLSDFAMSAGIAQIAFLALSPILTLSGFGLLRLALAVVSPFTNLLTSARILILAYFGRRRKPDRMAVRVVAGASGSYALITVVYVTGVSWLPTHIGVILFGGLWPDARPLLLLAGVAEAIRVAAFPAIDFVKVFRPGVQLVGTRGLAGFTFAAGLLTGGAVAGPRGALIGLVFAQVVSLGYWLVRLQPQLYCHPRRDCEQR